MAARRDDPEQDCLNNITKYNSAALFLAVALQEEDADKFIEVYDNVIPKNLALDEISSIKDSARDLAALPQETLEALKKRYKPAKNSPNDNSKTKHHPIAVSNYSECRSVSVLPPQCPPSSAMAGATQRNGARVSSSSSKSRNESKSGKLWNNNNNIELMPRDSKNVHSVISFDILNGNGVASSNGGKSVNLSSNINSSVPDCSSRTALSNSKSVSNKLSNKNKLQNKSKGTAVLPAPYYEHKLLQSAVELIDSKPSTKSSTCPEPAFVDPSKPDQVLQVVAGKPDMAAAASSASTTNTKKTELRGVRLQANKNPLPNGSINNKKSSSRGVSSSALSSPKVNSVVVVNDETPLMGNSQRTDSSVCVKQPTKYGTTVPSNRHLQSSSAAAVDSDEPQDKGKFVLSSGDSDGTVANKPTTLGEQFEASKAIEGKKKKSKKKKKNKAAAPDAEKVLQQTTAAVANDQVDEFEDALSELPKKGVPSSDSLTSNEEAPTDNAGDSGGLSGAKLTLASKLIDGSFQVDNSKTVPNAEESPGGSADDATVTNCKKESETKDVKTEDTDTTHKTGAELTTHVQHSKSESDDSKPKLADTENNKMLSNNRNFDSLTLTAHSTEANDPPFVDMDETNAADDDGEFHTVMSSKKRNRLNRKTKGVSMEEKSYPYQNKQFDLRGGRGGMSAGMRKSSSEPASMARLGETEHKFPDRNTTNFSINSQDIAVDNNKYPLVSQLPPPKPNNNAPSNSGTVTLSYASKVKAGITQHQVQAKNTPVKFTLDDEHSDGHVSDSGIVIPQIDATVSTTPKSQRTNPSNVHPSNATVMTSNITVDGKTKDKVKPEQPLTAASATTTSGGTSPKFEISFGGFDLVRISHAPKSLKTSCPTMSSSSEGLQSSLRPLQKVARSNSVDGLETDGAAISDNSSHQSTTQQHQEANVQYLDLHQSNTYAGMLKKRLPSSQGAPPPARRQVVEEPVQVTPSNQVMMEPAKNLGSVEKNEYSSKVGVDARPSQPVQVASPQIHDVGKFPVAPAPAAATPPQPRVENKSHQELKATYNASNQVVASPTPSITSSKGASRSVCIPLSMEPMDLGITFGDVNISEVLKEQEVARQDSPVDKIMADSGAVASSLPQVPSTGHNCAALETAWRDENKDGSPEAGDAGVAGNQRELGVSFLQTGGGGGDTITNIGNFNYYEVADMLMKAWTSTLEQKEANPSKVQYYPIDEACI